MPNRHEEEHGNFYNGHLIASETYVGGHVEALEAGVFRSDIETDFVIQPASAQKVRFLAILGEPASAERRVIWLTIRRCEPTLGSRSV
jgi:hypothetical protein